MGWYVKKLTDSRVLNHWIVLVEESDFLSVLNTEISEIPLSFFLPWISICNHIICITQWLLEDMVESILEEAKEENKQQTVAILY